MKIFFTTFALLFTLAACNNNAAHSDHDMAAHKMADSSGATKPVTSASITGDMMNDMHRMKPTGDNDLDFATMMTAHHKGAVQMAQLELTNGSDSALKTFAEGVIAAQEQEISFMNDFIAKHTKQASPDATEFTKAMDGSMMAMMQHDVKEYNDIDKDFAAQMIPHHQSAVDMAKAYLQFGKDESLRKLSEDIIAAQTKEIVFLKTKL